MSKARRSIKSSAKSGTVKRSQVRAAAKELRREREASPGRYAVKR